MKGLISESMKLVNSFNPFGDQKGPIIAEPHSPADGFHFDVLA
jgi:hypothetical protein